MEDITYRNRLKEAFVSNQNGTSLFEVTSVLSYAPMSIIVHFGLLLLMGTSHGNAWLWFHLDFIILVIPGLLNCTLLVNYTELVNVTLFVIGALTLLMKYLLTQMNSRDPEKHRHENYTTNKNYVSNLRAFMNIGTTMMILAVDFPIFPRRFVKTEIYGTGLMDIGVGAFIIGHAIVSPEARGRVAASSKYDEIWSAIKRDLSSISPLCIIGIARLISVKGSSYHEHVTEYGVHWNFFFTLAFVKVASGIFLILASNFVKNIIGIVGICIGISYQVMLSYFGLSDFIQNGTLGDGSRNGIFDSNREGILSLLGYLSLYFIALQLGKEIFKERSKSSLLVLLIVCDVIFWFLTKLSIWFIEPVSRRSANFSFVLWEMATNTYLLCCFLAVDILKDTTIKRTWTELSRSEKNSDDKDLNLRNKKCRNYLVDCPLLIQAISKNQLMYFLLANILTGIVNMSMDTIHADSQTSILVILIYLVVLNGVTVYMYVQNITTKIW